MRKPCKNGSHFHHDGGSRTPPEFLDKFNPPWMSFTIRDPYNSIVLKRPGCYTLKQWLLCRHSSRWDAPWTGWTDVEDHRYLDLAVFSAKGIK